ncbi:MAG TPA: GDP-fucose synthetase, partial [Methylophaga sp.]|nr:GDP-fucose synthetase [Methylophaga sp.]
MNNSDKIYVAGHRGLVGSALVRNLEDKGYSNILKRTHTELDLTDEKAVAEFFKTEKPDYVFLAAAKVGGILANRDFPAHFIYDNLMIQSNIIDSSRKFGVKKLLFLGSSCIYPKMCEQPIKEEYLMTGPLEPTNDAYAIAKIAGIKMCQAYRQQYGFNAISLMPTNLYGPGDNFHPENSHVMPALIRRFHEAEKSDAPKVTCWGDGSAMREFLHVDDLAEACYVCMQDYDEDYHINVGTGEDVTIKELAET